MELINKKIIYKRRIKTASIWKIVKYAIYKSDQNSELHHQLKRQCDVANILVERWKEIGFKM